MLDGAGVVAGFVEGVSLRMRSENWVTDVHFKSLTFSFSELASLLLSIVCG